MSKATYHKLHNAKQPKQHIINCCASESHVTTATYFTPEYQHRLIYFTPEYQHRLILEDSEVYNKIIDESNNTKQSLFKKLINIIRRYH